VRFDRSFNGAGGKKIVDRFGGGRSEQRCDLRDWLADSAVWIYSREFILYWGVCSEYSVVATGTGGSWP
jgi:hypothetical protein